MSDAEHDGLGAAVSNEGHSSRTTDLGPLFTRRAAGGSGATGSGPSAAKGETSRLDLSRVDLSRMELSRLDAVAWLRTLPSESVDLVLTDPAYESLEKHRAIGTTTRLKHSKSSSNDWFEIFPNARFPELFAELHRVLRKNRHCYFYCDAETMFVIKPIAEAAGFKFWKPLVWDKRKIGMGYHYRARYELVLFFEKGKRKLNDLGQADVIEVPRVFKGYPTEKPTRVADILIRQSTAPGELVIDPFMGSGSTAVAALAAKRRFAGTDTSEVAQRVTRERLSG